MQRTISECDACGAEMPSGFVVVTVGGDRAAIVKGRLPGNRPSLELCDTCAVSLAEWAAGRSLPPEAVPVAGPEAAPGPTPAPTRENVAPPDLDA